MAQRWPIDPKNKKATQLGCLKNQLEKIRVEAPERALNGLRKDTPSYSARLPLSY